MTKITWANAVFKLVTGSAVLYVMYGAFTNFFEAAIDLAFYSVDPSVLDMGSKALFVTFMIAELALIFFVFYTAVRVEYDRYLEY